ncbi:MAG: hypothetical protein GY828_05870 [Candidatus Gracilibacteria bacterium]|nr:hypothetical protein [Candidatus Gracilibacteria bacterium]
MTTETYLRMVKHAEKCEACRLKYEEDLRNFKNNLNLPKKIDQNQDQLNKKAEEKLNDLIGNYLKKNVKLRDFNEEKILGNIVEKVDFVSQEVYDYFVDTDLNEKNTEHFKHHFKEYLKESVDILLDKKIEQKLKDLIKVEKNNT